MQITPLNPFGVQVTNVDVTCADHMSRIQELLWNNGVVVLPAGAALQGAQPVHDDASMLALGKLFGSSNASHPVNPNKSATSPVQVLKTRGQTGIPADSFIFHSDKSWRVNPSKASVMCAYQLPSSGGDTCFQSTNNMYNRLSPEVQEKVSKHTFKHSLKVGYARANRPDEVADNQTALHPGVVIHPNSGAPCLFVNEHFTVSCEGLENDESDALLK